MSARICDTSGTNALRSCARLPSRRCSSSPPRSSSSGSSREPRRWAASRHSAAASARSRPRTPRRALSRAPRPRRSSTSALPAPAASRPERSCSERNPSTAISSTPTRTFPRVERATPDPALLATARRLLPEAAVLPIGTSARVGGGASCADVEAMEGFAVLRAAAAAGVPALELRAVSNGYGADRSSLARRGGARGPREGRHDPAQARCVTFRRRFRRPSGPSAS